MALASREVDQAYNWCRDVTRREAKNFYYAFITLPRQQRKAIYAAYAFCRLCDDAVDEDGPLPRKLELLSQLREQLVAAFSGEPVGSVFSAVAHSAATYGISQELYQEIINGVEADLTTSRYQDFQELRTYCYRVASVVGLICIEIFGYRDPRARQYAIDLGLAMQLTNIIRDVEEDLGRDRIYLPQEDLDRFGYSEERLAAGEMDERALFYMLSRGLDRETAERMLIRAFADDIVEKIKPDPLRRYIEDVTTRLMPAFRFERKV